MKEKNNIKQLQINFEVEEKISISEKVISTSKNFGKIISFNKALNELEKKRDEEIINNIIKNTRSF